MRYRLRTLVVAVALAPPLLAALWFLGIGVVHGDYTSWVLFGMGSYVAILWLAVWVLNYWLASPKDG